MPLELGSHGLMTSAWTSLMRKRFASYALGRDGKPIKVDGYFGYDEESVQREYQRRTGQRPAPEDVGKVSDDDLHRLGLLPTLFSVHGTGQADPFGIGMPADAARRCLDLYRWQPVGDYPATAIPMNKSADAGERSLAGLINDRRVTPGPFAMFDYSQGAICGGRVRNRIRNGDLTARQRDFMGSASWGPPMRPFGSYAGTQDPGGEGLDPTLETAAEKSVLQLAAKGDLYTTKPRGNAGEWEQAIFNMTFSKFIGKDTLSEQLWELAKDPFSEVPAMFRAIWNGGMFVAQNPPTAPHVTYHLRECPGTGMTFYEFGIKHIRDLATARLEAIAAA